MRMSSVDTKQRTKAEPKAARPKAYKVVLFNDDFTPREFVVGVLKKLFGMSESSAHRVMLTAHTRGACVVSMYTRDVAETKVQQGVEEGRKAGYPLMFTTEPEQ